MKGGMSVVEKDGSSTREIEQGEIPVMRSEEGPIQALAKAFTFSKKGSEDHDGG
jgi:hypothetical protein